MSVGCRNSWPIPSISFRLPALATDIINPDTPATFSFALKYKDLYRNPQTHKNKALEFPALVQHGDFVLIPTGYNGITSKMEQLYMAMSNPENKAVYLRFEQGSQVWDYYLPLDSFAKSYEAALMSCTDDEGEHDLMPVPEIFESDIANKEEPKKVTEEKDTNKEELKEESDKKEAPNNDEKRVVEETTVTEEVVEEVTEEASEETNENKTQNTDTNDDAKNSEVRDDATNVAP